MTRAWNRGVVTALVLGIALLSGCGTLTKGQRSSQFGVQMLAFENAIRWGRFKSADTFRRHAPGEMPAEHPEYDGVKVTAYEVLSQRSSDEGNHVTRVVKIDYYRDTNPGVRTLEHVQEWVYDTSERLWYLDSELPKFR